MNITHWAVWFTVEGDLRFLSHRNMMTLCERSAARAELPIKFSEGFNPRPKLSLPLPRPVGVSSRCELLIIGLKQDSPPLSESGLAWRLGEQFPDGMELIKAEPLPAKARVRIKAVTYELAMNDSEQRRVKAQLASLEQSPKWEVPRRPSPAGAKAAKAGNSVDIRGQIDNIGILQGPEDGSRLSFTLASTGSDGPIGPKRVLTLLGLADVAEALAGLKKTALECEF